MGYPMSYRRLLNRNGLVEGDYLQAPQRWPSTTVNSDVTAVAVAPDVAASVLTTTTSKLKYLCGDLRRLERDAIDEDGLCRLIALRTSIDAEVVAAVLKEFVAI